MYNTLFANTGQLTDLIPLCRSTATSADDHNLFNSSQKASVAVSFKPLFLISLHTYYIYSFIDE
jgi:hypothetical protein